jgi:hypothetical protein
MEQQMNTKTRQAWIPGQTVKVGFLSLVVKAQLAATGDGLPGAFILTNAAGTQLYRSIPFNGVEKISAIEATALLAAQEEAAARATFRALQKAKADALRAAEISTLFA